MDFLFTDAIGVWVAALLTIFVFSYLLRGVAGFDFDLLFRVASALLVGTAVGYISAVVIQNVLLPLIPHLVNDISVLAEDIGSLGKWLVLLLDVLPIFLGITLFIKLLPNFRTTTISNLGLAYLFGLGAALAIGGALAGALVPQLTATMLQVTPPGDDWSWVNSLLIVIGTLGTFLAFRFIQPGPRTWQRAYDMVTRGWGTIGRAFLMITFGALLASLIAARVSALVGQLYFLLHDVLNLI